MNVRYTESEIEHARAWLQDNEWGDMEPEDFLALSPLVIVRGVNRFYDGGWDQFLKDCA